MKQALRLTMAALAALVFTAARADERGNPGAIGPAGGDVCQCPPDYGAGRGDTGRGGEAAGRYEGEEREEAEGEPGSAGREPGRAERPAEAGVGSSVHVDPGYYVQDPRESQFLLETWTSGG